MAKLRPIDDRVVVKRIEEVKKSPIELPDTAKEKPVQGEVIAVGPGKLLENGRRIPLSVKVKDKVIFGKYSGNEVKIDDEEYLILRESEILGILE
jgi:chaperonin GroES